MPTPDGKSRWPLIVAVVLLAGAAIIIGLRVGRSTTPAPEGNTDDSSETAPLVNPTTPPVRFEPAFLDFGEVPPNAVLPELVRIINEGDQPVTLAALIPSCACIGAETATSAILPGGALDVRIRYQTGDRAEQQVSYTLTATFEGYMGGIQLPVRSSTTHLYRVAATDEPHRITITSADGSPISITSHPAFVEQVIVAAAPPDTAILVVRQGLADDDRTRMSALELDHPRFGRIVIDWPVPQPGEWPVPPRTPLPQVQPEPLEVALPNTADGEPVLVTVVLRGLRESQLERLTTIGDGPRPFIAEIADHRAVETGVELTMRLMFDFRARRAGSILFLYDGEPLCRVGLRSQEE